MSTQAWLSQLQKQRAIAVIRAPKLELGLQMALAVAAGGMQIIEITWNSHRPEELIPQLRHRLPECTIGTGTLFNLQQLELAIACGSQFLFTPHVDSTMIRAALAKNIPIIPGALTPTEIVTAWSAGASCVKVFPVQAMGGAKYIKSLQAPLGHIPLIPTGGVRVDNAKALIQAGAIAVGLSGELFPKQLITTQNWQEITQLAHNLMEQLA